MFGIQFYPTPLSLVEKMYNKVKWHKVKSILEPSAGKGDIIKGLKNTFIKEEKEKCSKYDLYDRTSKWNVSIDCVEIDPNLVAILKDERISGTILNAYNVTQADFLTWDTFSRYDLIAMNPPFIEGDKHLLKAIELCRTGGQIVCILNAETLRNPYSNIRQDLVNKLNEYHADIEYLQDEFIDSERKTDVEIALVYIDIPTIEYDYDMFTKMNRAQEYKPKYDSMSNDYQLATNDVIANVLKQYNDECILGLSLIDTFDRFENIIPKGERDNALIGIHINSRDSDNEKYSKHNAFLRELRAKYWNILFSSDAIAPMLTQATRDYFRANLEQFRAFDFTLSNIKEIQLELSKRMSTNMEDAILKQFDKLTYKNSMSNSSNVHYYNGWCTNDAYKLNKKIIIPCYGVFDARYCNSWDLWKAEEKLDEIEKILIFLNGGFTAEHRVDWIIRSYQSSKNYNGEKIHCAFFDIEFKKKGTIHLWFTNEELLKKWNIFAGKKKNFLPNDYGTKTYKDMTSEEQKIVNEFEGEKSYEKTVSNQNYYLGTVLPMALTTTSNNINKL